VARCVASRGDGAVMRGGMATATCGTWGHHCASARTPVTHTTHCSGRARMHARAASAYSARTTAASAPCGGRVAHVACTFRPTCAAPSTCPCTAMTPPRVCLSAQAHRRTRARRTHRRRNPPLYRSRAARHHPQTPRHTRLLARAATSIACPTPPTRVALSSVRSPRESLDRARQVRAHAHTYHTTLRAAPAPQSPAHTQPPTSATMYAAPTVRRQSRHVQQHPTPPAQATYTPFRHCHRCRRPSP
jgi:hypothetical protein